MLWSCGAGQAGAAAVVPAELDGANCIDLLIIRRSRKLRPRFLEYVLNSDWTAKHIGELLGWFDPVSLQCGCATRGAVPSHRSRSKIAMWRNSIDSPNVIDVLWPS